MRTYYITYIVVYLCGWVSLFMCVCVYVKISRYIIFIHTRTVLYIINALHCVIIIKIQSAYVDNNGIIVR